MDHNTDYLMPRNDRLDGRNSPLQHRLATLDVEDSVAIIRIRRERARHSLNPATVYQLHSAVQAAQWNPAVRGIVVTGSGATFGSGADIRYFLAAIEQRRIDRILTFTQAGYECCDAIENCSKPVVAALNGSALGGALELAMACRRRVAAPGASLALPETGLGLFPGWGGILRADRLLPRGLAKWLVYTGQTISARDAMALGLIDQVTTPMRLLEHAKALALDCPQTPLLPSRPSCFDAQVIAAFFQAHTVDDILSHRMASLPVELAPLRQSLANKGRLALRLAEQLFSSAETLTPEELKSANLRLVAEAFHSDDVYRRLKAVLSARAGPARLSPIAST